MNNSVNISDESNIPEFIRDSWLRCGKIMQRDFWAQPHQAQGLTFDSICRRKTAMLTLGQAALGGRMGIHGAAKVCAVHSG
ncbi:DNA-binding transcriptional regulator DhaR [Citrobacter amalonaticus]|nr:DNA-binding transcriptional regulator DhaR [Citrobacter amalonaticus]